MSKGGKTIARRKGKGERIGQTEDEVINVKGKGKIRIQVRIVYKKK